ncbi:MAG: ferritin family protein [Nitrospirota bacterium]|nr:ferritin family protein [Nitrospirota bacterium]
MKAVEMAMKMEEDAINFYSEAAEKTGHPFGKKMFESFALDEKRHLEMLKDIFKGLNIEIREGDPGKAVKSIFETLKSGMMERIEATTDEINALKMALDMEKEGFEYYKEVADGTSDEKEKRLFQRLAGEEEKHYNILQNTYAFLSDTGNWFMWDEHAIVDGGTPWA